MKTTFKTLLFSLAIVTLFINCTNENAPATTNSSITNSGTITGTIDSYDGTVFDNIPFNDGTSTTVPVTLSSNGKFSIVLPIPKNMTSVSNLSSSFTISDHTASIFGLGSGGTIEICKSTTSVGQIAKCNLSLQQIQQIQQGGTGSSLGEAISMFIYADKNVSIKGTETSSGYSANYDLNLKKGWNEAVQTITAVSSSGQTVSFTSIIPSNMKWIFITDTSTTPTNTPITDVDGNIYHSVTIGNQIWLVENLKTTKYRDGTTIPNVTDQYQWTWQTSSGAYCNYNNSTSYVSKYGRLYNSYAIRTGKLAPAGWHVATQTEWSTLISYVSAHLGSSTSVSRALSAPTDWSTYIIYGTTYNNLSSNNSSGFTALPAGVRNGSGFTGLGTTTAWWDGIELQYNTNTYDWANTGSLTTAGYSIRCIKD